MDAAFATYEAMLASSASPRCRPTSWTFCILVAACGRAGQAERAAILVKKLKASGAPIMLVWGDEERLNPVELGDDIAKVLDWAEYHRIAGAGHNIPNDQPARVSELLVRFLNA